MVKHRYIVIEDDEIEDLQNRVNHLMDSGFDIVGGISTFKGWAGNDQAIFYCQALIKLVDD